MMKKLLFRFAKILLFTAGLLSAFYAFLPYRELGSLAVSMGSSRLSRMGMKLNYSDVTGEKNGFTVHNMRLSGITEVSMSSITIRPLFSASILSLSPVCEIDFKGCNVRFGQNLNIGDGGLLLTAGNEILLENLHTSGEFSLNGWITIDTGTMKIGHADAKIEVPESFSQNMGMLRNFLPLVQEGSSWFLRR